MQFQDLRMGITIVEHEMDLSSGTIPESWKLFLSLNS